jgi:hypothetical protein
MASPDHYIPGVCNIGPAEQKLRARSGWIGLAAAAVLGGILVASQAPPLWRLLVFLPAFSAATGFLQSALHFCLGFGFKSVFNFGEPGRMDSVAEAEFRRIDRRKAQSILAYSALIGLAAALLAYWI